MVVRCFRIGCVGTEIDAVRCHGRLFRDLQYHRHCGLSLLLEKLESMIDGGVLIGSSLLSVVIMNCEMVWICGMVCCNVIIYWSACMIYQTHKLHTFTSI